MQNNNEYLSKGTLSDIIKRDHIGFSSDMENITIEYEDPYGKNDWVDFDAKSEEELTSLFKTFLIETYKNDFSINSVISVGIGLTEKQQEEVYDIDNCLNVFITKLIKMNEFLDKDNDTKFKILTKLNTEDFFNSCYDKIKDTINTALGEDVLNLHYPRLVTKDDENGNKITYVKELVEPNDSFFSDDEGEKF